MVNREIKFDAIFDSQRCYRLLLDSMSRPGVINRFYDMDLTPPAPLLRGASVVALSLLNADTTFCYLGEQEQVVSKYILLNTAATPEQPEKADFVFLTGSAKSDIISKMKTGTLSYPEEGATVVLSVDSLAAQQEEGAMTIVLQGPGVEHTKRVFIRGLNADVLQQLCSMNTEFPLGIDAILVDKHNHLICIPRSNKITWSQL